MNAKIQKFIKCTLQHIWNMLQYEIYSPLPSNKTSQGFTTLHKAAQGSAQRVAQ